MNTVVGSNVVAVANDAAVRKAAVRLLPLLALGYGIAYMDRVNIGFAALQMNADLHFSATVYGFGGGLFFVSYAVLEVPSNLMLVRFGARRWLARIMLTWGLLAVAMMFVRTPLQFYVTRFFLGAAEAGFFPGVVLYLSYWFPASYRGRAISRFYFAYPLSSILMGAVAAPLLGMQGLGGVSGWQWLFLIEGIPAVLLSGVYFFCLPDRPRDARWLTAAEQSALIAQLATHHTGQRHTLRDTLHTLRNKQIIMFGAANLCLMGGSYAAGLSAPLVLREVTGWNTSAIGLLVSISFMVAAVAMVANGSHSDQRRERRDHTIVPLIVVALAFVAMASRYSVPVVVVAYALSVIGHAAAQATFWLMPADEFRGHAAEVGIAAIGSIGMIGAFAGPFAFGAARDYTGNYQVGLLAVSGMYVVGIIFLLYSRSARPLPLTSDIQAAATAPV